MIETSGLFKRTFMTVATVLAVAWPTALAAPVAQAAAPAPSVLFSAAPLVKAKKAKKPKITTQPKSATISRYGTVTAATFTVKAKSPSKKIKLTYQWQYAAGTRWLSIAKATKSSYVARSTAWANGARFRVVVAAKKVRTASRAVTLGVLYPTNTPAADAMARFGLTGLTQGVDLSGWQWGINTSAVNSWTGASGFTLLRNGSGSRPINTAYQDLCTKANANTNSTPITKDCAYATFADASARHGHYWFNGWISTSDTTANQAFAGGYTPQASATQFVSWLLADGNYTTASTDPLVLDIEDGSVWTKTVNGKKVSLKLRKWNSAEAVTFVNTVKTTLANAGYHANMYVYMNANEASRKTSTGAYYWAGVAAISKLWVASWGTDNGRIPAAQPATGPWATRGGWSIWQYTDNARIVGSGVAGLDADIAKSTAWTPLS